MHQLSAAYLLQAAMWVYVVAGLGSLAALRREKLANLIGFGGAALAGVCGLPAGLVFLLSGTGISSVSFDLWEALVPYVRLTVKLDGLRAFFLLILSALALASSASSVASADVFDRL